MHNYIRPIVFSVVASFLIAALYLFQNNDIGGKLLHGESQIEQAVASIDEGTEVLFLGASHVYTSVDPDEIPYNIVGLSSGSWNYEAQYAVLKKHVHKLKGLKLCVIELGNVPFTINTLHNRMHRFSGDLSAYRKFGLNYFEIPRLNIFKSMVYTIQEMWPIFVLTHGKKHNIPGPPDRIWAKEKSNASSFERVIKPGYANVSSSIADHQNRKNSEKHRKPSIYNSRKYNRAALIKIIDMLEDLDVQIVFITYPSLCPDIENLDEVSFVARATLTQPYVYWDLSRSNHYSETHFRDKNHLNIAGAIIFSRELTQRIESYAKDSNLQLQKK